jgi:anti-sigma B factor antagonist
VEIKLRRSSTIYIVDIIGEMDLYNSFKLKDVLKKMIQKNIRHYIINLDQVEYLDSSGIGALIYAHSELKKRKMLLRIVNIKGSVKKVIELTKLIGYFHIAQNVPEGIRQIKEQI